MEEDELDVLAALYTNHFLDYDIYQVINYAPLSIKASSNFNPRFLNYLSTS